MFLRDLSQLINLIIHVLLSILPKRTVEERNKNPSTLYVQKFYFSRAYLINTVRIVMHFRGIGKKYYMGMLLFSFYFLISLCCYIWSLYTHYYCYYIYDDNLNLIENKRVNK